MECEYCKKDTVLEVDGKVSDLCNSTYRNKDVGSPGIVGIGSGDYLMFEVCLNCGMLQGIDFPIIPHWAEE
jgi:hypothetical protein